MAMRQSFTAAVEWYSAQEEEEEEKKKVGFAGVALHLAPLVDAVHKIGLAVASWGLDAAAATK